MIHIFLYFRLSFGRKVFYINLSLFITYMCLMTWYMWSVGDFAVQSEFDLINYCPVFNYSGLLDNATLEQYKQVHVMPCAYIYICAFNYFSSRVENKIL